MVRRRLCGQIFMLSIITVAPVTSWTNGAQTLLSRRVPEEKGRDYHVGDLSTVPDVYP